jgi:hypothetical protein
MLRLKKKKEAEVAAALEVAPEAASSAMDVDATPTGAPEAEATGGGLSLMGGIGGKKVTKGAADAGKKRRTPGEIRIQKGENEHR